MADGLPAVLAAAQRAISAWMTVGALAAEIEALRWSADGLPVPAPGLGELVLEADMASQAAQIALDAAQRGPDGGVDALLAEARHRAEEAELAARRTAQLCLGVSSCLSSSDAVSRSEHACVMVLGGFLADLADDGLPSTSEHWAEAEVELCGLICRMIVERPVGLAIRLVTEELTGLIELELDEGSRLVIGLELDGRSEALDDRLVEVGWSLEAGELFARIDGDVVVREVSQLLVETARDVLGIPTADGLDLELRPAR